MPRRLSTSPTMVENAVAAAVGQEAVELLELAPLPLPAHPHALARVPPPGAVEELERPRAVLAVPRVQRLDARDGRRHDRRIARQGLGRGVGEVAQDGELEVGLAVGEVLHLEVLQRLLDRLDAGEERRHHHRRPELVGHASRRDRAWAASRGGRNAVSSWLTVVTAMSLAGSSARSDHQRPGRDGAPGRRASSNAASARTVPSSTPPTNTTLGWRVAQRSSRADAGGR